MSEGGSGSGASSRKSLYSNESTDSTRRKELYELCQKDAFRERDWDLIRNWFATNSSSDACDAAMYRGREGTAALHMVCQNYPPLDIVQILIKANPDAVDWDDEFGWLPLHYACHHGISEEVIEFLLSHNSRSLHTTDKKGRNPLHFAVGNLGKKAGLFRSVVFSKLAQDGAVNVADKKGMLPLHYACAYGASENTIEILISAYPSALSKIDLNGFLPLHYAIGNCDREDCAVIVKKMLDYDPGVINIDFEHKSHPLHVLGNRANRFRGTNLARIQANAIKSMNFFLDLGPMPKTNFFAALHTMPKWLLDKAVVHPKVQELLNDEISRRFPTAVMMIDFYAISTVVISFAFLAIEAIDKKEDTGNGLESSKLTPMYLCVIYFALREFVQVLSFIHLGLFSVWFRRGTNWLEIGLIVLILFWAIIFDTGAMKVDALRTWTALSSFFFWVNFLNFLRGLLVEFAVFVSGVLHVVRRLGPFLLALMIILIAFMQMFYVAFLETDYCKGYNDHENNITDTCDPEGDDSEPYRFCSNWRTFLSVYTMLLGEVDESDFEDSNFATLLFVVFIFLVVILLANVLIAIVSDSYRVIRKERAAIVFWSSRLDFIVEMGVISSGLFKNVGNGNSRISEENKEDSLNPSNASSTKLWKSIVDIFDEDLNQQVEVWSWTFLCLVLVRIATIFIFIPLWIVVGLFTAGWAWPDQWRKRLLEQKITNHGNEPKDHHGLKAIKDDLNGLQREVRTKLISNQDEVSQLKADVIAMQKLVNEDSKEIRKAMSMLLEARQMMIS